eukprot:m.1643430 g.1643430  ORF g.1643430 m.1643430 type:complete len:73 (+) comp58174_c0_seq1:70-288(+)
MQSTAIALLSLYFPPQWRLLHALNCAMVVSTSLLDHSPSSSTMSSTQNDVDVQSQLDTNVLFSVCLNGAHRK